ncbi:HAMP domain-containing sensor histidine kinase [Novosphingobium resinovorum]|uniref:sensor histidine kinase n=1 Tax=Novosphingobium TaxID=165696 RepID=UPI001B3C946A|nr:MULTISPECIES: HAMP domain-containing sensor histidine kinase [Novosphingobium]MBF7010061.1 HAMP domain-containing histidine kinase [Novosphingobium sp. HR1a]WJM28081.1 HAMP domain-containing sensor histidine kinase [Novosphingobium resinovorum]
MKRLAFIRNSIFAQIVVWAIGTAAVITFGLWLLTNATIERSNRQALERAVDVDLAGMVDIYASGDRDELAKRIKDRLALQPRNGDPAHYLLADARGKRIAGDLTDWPGLHAGISEAADIRIEGGERAFARATQLGPNLKLLVAHEYRDLSMLLRQVALVFLTGGVLAMLAVALGGWTAAHRLAGRLARINAAFRQPDDAALEELARGSAGHDEIDELAAHSGNALARLKRLAAAHRETTDHVAHEMRTPLMHLDNRLVKALAATPDAETAARVADARTEIRGIIRMLESLLDIAASEARRGDRHGLVPVDLSVLAARLGELYADSAEDSGHRLILDIEPDVVIAGEEMSLTRLITNLLDNAFKFVPRGGTIRLTLRRGPVLIVSDDGPGVPEDQRDRIFEKFARGGSSLGTEGAGLGLALCRAIAERHHLEISLAPGERGACFTVAPEFRR